MGWLDKRRFDHAAKLYALKLPQALAEGWGGSTYYTPEQIRVAATKMKLPPRFIAIAYAAYLPEKTYVERAAQMPMAFPYDQAREAFFAHVAPHLTGDGFEPPPLRSEVMSGAGMIGH